MLNARCAYSPCGLFWAHGTRNEVTLIWCAAFQLAGQCSMRHATAARCQGARVEGIARADALRCKPYSTRVAILLDCLRIHIYTCARYYNPVLFVSLFLAIESHLQLAIMCHLVQPLIVSLTIHYNSDTCCSVKEKLQTVLDIQTDSVTKDALCLEKQCMHCDEDDCQLLIRRNSSGSLLQSGSDSDSDEVTTLAKSCKRHHHRRNSIAVKFNKLAYIPSDS